MVLVLLMFCSLARADEYSSPNATKKIEQYVIKHDREGAMQWLDIGIEKTKSRPKEQAFLIEKLKAIAQIFFTDEGQKSFEAASSLYFFSPKEARLKAEKAMVEEPGNVRILQLLAMLDLKDGKCRLAAEKFTEFPKWVFNDSQRAYHKNLISYCEMSEAAEYEIKSVDLPLRDFFAGIRSMSQGDPKLAHGNFVTALEKNKDFPEIYYWLWKTDSSREDYGKRYVQFCATPDPKMLRKYRDFPFLCAKAKEMPTFEVKDEL